MLTTEAVAVETKMFYNKSTTITQVSSSSTDPLTTTSPTPDPSVIIVVISVLIVIIVFVVIIFITIVVICYYLNSLKKIKKSVIEQDLKKTKDKLVKN